MKQGFTVWITGMHCSGKSTTAKLLAENLEKLGYKPQIFDGKKIRSDFDPDLGFDRIAVQKNIERIGFECKLITDRKYVAIAATVSPYKDIRNKLREKIGKFIEIFCDAPIDVLKKRDCNNFYTRAESGKLQNVAGINAPYEPPDKPEVYLDTSKELPQECIKKILNTLKILGYIESTGKHLYNKNEEDIIKDRLKNLGYI